MDITLSAKKRNTNVKTKVLRGQGWVPACVYGHHWKSMPIQIQTKDLTKCLASHASMITLNIEGAGTVLVGFEEVQKNHMGNELVHISFHALAQNEKADLEVPIDIIGKAKGQQAGGIIKEQFHTITVRGFPKDLPDRIVIDVTELELGDNVHVYDLVSKYKCEFLKEDMDKILVSCSHPKIQLVPETVVEETTEEVATDTAAAAGTTTVNPAAAATTEKKAA